MEVSPTVPAPRSAPDLALAAALAAIGLLVRLWFVSLFPAAPVSDFRAVVDFARAIAEQGLTAPGYYWEVLNVGPALVLALLFALLPGDAETVARLATATWTGLAGLLPFFVWRGVLPLWVRTLAGALLALWPGQVMFSGVVAQDNWVTTPAVALACVAVRSLVRRRTHPVLAGALFALAVAMRQEMLYVLLPLLAASSGLLHGDTRRWRPVVAALLAAGVPLLALAWQRHSATGHFALSSGHVGYTLLGSVVPGATRIGWSDPMSFAASVRPDLAADRQRLLDEAMPLALDELRRRPTFHLLRSLAAGVSRPFRSDADNLHWSLNADGVLPPARQPDAAVLFRRAWPLLVGEAFAIQALFLAAVVVGIRRRSGPILVVAAAVLLKIALHAALVSAERFYVPATALQLLVVALGCREAVEGFSWRGSASAVAAGALGAGLLLLGATSLHGWVRTHDPDLQRTYRFTLRSWGSTVRLDCAVRTGKLTSLGYEEATIEPLADDGSGGRAVAQCEANVGAEPTKVSLAVSSRALAGEAAAPAVERIEADGRAVLDRTLAGGRGAPTVAVPLGTLAKGQRRVVRVETGAATRGARSAGAVTTFRLLGATAAGT